MNFEGNAPQYSAFAIVAIESVWPNPEGNEIPPDTYDTDLLTEAGVDTDYSEQIGQGSYERTGFQLTGASTESAYQQREGYYKILPLNVIKVDTRASHSGSEFKLSFTLDDLLLVTESGTDFLNATGLPLQSRDLVHLGDDKSLPILFRDEDRGDWEYVQDSELGLSRYKINGASSSFNIEDLVTPNDTVTIWIYHDPSDFYLKDEIPEVIDDSDLSVNDDIKNIVGSGDRRNQFSDNTTTFEESVLGNMGLINRYIGESITASLLAQEAEEVRLSREELDEAIRSFVEEAASGSLEDEETLFEYSGNFLNLGASPIPTGEFNNIYENLLLPYLVPNKTFGTDESFFTPDIEEDEDEEEEEEEEKGRALARRIAVQAKLRETLAKMVNTLGFDETTNSFYVDEGNQRELFGLIADIPYFTTRAGFGDSTARLNIYVEQFARALSFFKISLEGKIANYQREYIKNKTTITAEQRFSHGRKVLINDFSGETPYLALKGKISNISVSVGITNGTHTVTLTGYGYEKTLNEHEIFYEDLLYPGASAAPQSDYMSSYGLMIPPRAMVDILNRYASRQVVLGDPTDFTQAAFQSFLQLAVQLGEEESEEEEEENRVDTSLLEDGGPLKGQIPLRGNFLLSEFTTNATMKDIRLFHPVNYIDTTRVSEMARTLERSYEVPQEEAVINTAVFLSTRSSLMQNLKKLGGVAEFYQIFVDETGRLRYRLSFEAMERTPEPSITPIIQDEFVLNNASFTTNDSLVKTMVDVRPITGQHSFDFLDLGFVGRSVSPRGAVPIRGATRKNGVDISDAISPDLYRYGFKSLQIQDVYTSETNGAKRKAALYQQFYGKPIKQANVTVLNNTSYRVGNTALLALQRNKHRSRTLINLSKTLDWLNYIKGEEDLKEMYVGVDKRLIMRDAYIPTSSSYYPIPSETLQEQFDNDPKTFVLDRFIETFEYLIDTLPSLNVLTPDYFPPSYWYYLQSGGDDFYHWDEGTLRSDDIIRLYTNVLKAALEGNSVASGRVTEMFNTFPGIIQALKFHDFRATSYYIDQVAHTFAHGKDATTNLSLNFGQDNLVLLEPKRNLPIGFISIERKMRIGYDSPEQEKLFSESEQRSALQNMYLEQFREESEFRSASFLYRAQEFRNAASYMHTLARREGIMADVQVESTSEVVSNPTSTDGTVTNNEPSALALVVATEQGVEDLELIDEASAALRNADLTTNAEKISFLQDFYGES